MLNEFPLERVLRQVVDSTGSSRSPGDLLRRLFDTENTKARRAVPWPSYGPGSLHARWTNNGRSSCASSTAASATSRPC
ncbi:MAG: hypothetical protein K0R38_3465 [Polyangiaceae bacterium]|jgi:hypothetical protein|nr:hypothetical protein [Polyangiaceae bacterium]